MSKRPLCLAVVLFVLGTFYAQTGHTVSIILGLFLLIYHSLWAYQKRGRTAGRFRWILLVVIFLTAYFHTISEIQFREDVLTRLEKQNSTQIQGTIYKQESKSDTGRIYLNHCYMYMENKKIPCNQILVYLNTDTFSIGDTILINGTIKTLETARNKGNFDEKQFYQSQKIDFKFYGERAELLYHSNSRIKQWIFYKKKELKEIYINNTNQETAGLLQTMILGDRELLDQDIKGLYQQAGFSHILAISGLHISIIGMGLYRILQRCNIAFVFRGGAAAIFVLLFGLLTGAGPQAERAVIMFLIMMLGNVLGRSYDTASALSFSVIAILWKNPFLLFYAGFLLSLAAVLGICVIGKLLYSNRKEKLKDTFLMNCSIQLTTLPIIAYYYYEIPIYAMGINLLLLPSVGFLIFLGILGGISGFFSSTLSKGILFLCEIIFALYKKVCVFFLKLPEAIQIVGQPSKKVLIEYYFILIVCLMIFYYVRKKEIVMIGSVFVLGLLFFTGGEKQQFQIHVLDVGQGDATFIQDEDGTNFFIDGGSTDVSQVGIYRILPCLKAMRIKKVDVWFISHCDADHMNGLLEVLDSNYEVRKLVFSEYVVKNENYIKLVEKAEKQGCEIYYLSEGEQIKTNSISFLQCAKKQMAEADDANASSMVLLLQTESFRGILTGDIGIKQEKMLLKLRKVDWYKAAHHGAKESNSKEFLESLKPEIATISCGKDNQYGHPSKEALFNIEKAGAKIYDTRECGQISIYNKKNYIVIDMIQNCNIILLHK